MFLQIQNLDNSLLVFLAVLLLSVVGFFLKNIYSSIGTKIDTIQKSLNNIDAELKIFITKEVGTQALTDEKLSTWKVE